MPLGAVLSSAAASYPTSCMLARRRFPYSPIRVRILAFHLTAEDREIDIVVANAERLRYASLFGPFRGCYPATLFVCRITFRVAKAEG
jgi:hypothetical protein